MEPNVVTGHRYAIFISIGGNFILENSVNVLSYSNLCLISTETLIFLVNKTCGYKQNEAKFWHSTL